MLVYLYIENKITVRLELLYFAFRMDLPLAKCKNKRMQKLNESHNHTGHSHWFTGLIFNISIITKPTCLF